MTKSFMDKLREAEAGAGNPDEWPDYGELGERLIAIDDLTISGELPNCDVMAIGYTLATKEIRRILEGATK